MLLAAACCWGLDAAHRGKRPGCECQCGGRLETTVLPRRRAIITTHCALLDHAVPSQLLTGCQPLCRAFADSPLQAKTPHSRTTSTATALTRPKSTSSYAQSIGPVHRPQTSMSNNFGQSVNGNGRARANTSRRPATAMGNRGPDPDTSTGSQCTNSPASFSFTSQRLSCNSTARNGALFNPRLRPSSSMPSFIPTASPATRATAQNSTQASSRQSSLASLVSKFGHMTINEEGEGDGDSNHSQNGGQVNSKRDQQRAARADHQPGPRLSDTTVRAAKRAKVVGQ